MNFFTDRMARAMDELIAIAASLDDLPAGIVDFPAEWAMAGSYFCLDEGQGRVPSLPDQSKISRCFTGTVRPTSPVQVISA